MSYQKITILGRVGNDAELRFTPSGSAVASFSLASNETWKDGSGQKQERTTWHRCTLWGKVAEALAEHVTKGKMLLVEGAVTARAYTDKSGEAKASLEVKVDQLRFAGGSAGNGDATGNSDSTWESTTTVADSKEIPF